MEKKEQDTSNLEYDKDMLPDDYEFLVQKLKNIKKTINLLEKNFLKKEI